MHIVEKFLPKGVRKSARAMYLEMIGAACSYLLDLDINKYTVAVPRRDSLFELDEEPLRFGETFTDPEPINPESLENIIVPEPVRLTDVKQVEPQLEEEKAVEPKWNLICFG